MAGQASFLLQVFSFQKMYYVLLGPYICNSAKVRLSTYLNQKICPVQAIVIWLFHWNGKQCHVVSSVSQSVGGRVNNMKETIQHTYVLVQTVSLSSTSHSKKYNTFFWPLITFATAQHKNSY